MSNSTITNIEKIRTTVGIEKAKAIRAVMSANQWPIEQVAERVGEDANHLSMSLLLFRLCPRAQALLTRFRIDAEAAVSVIEMNPFQQIKHLEQLGKINSSIDDSSTSLSLDEEVALRRERDKACLLEMSNELTKRLAQPVSVQYDDMSQKGSITIDCFGIKGLDQLLGELDRAFPKRRGTCD